VPLNQQPTMKYADHESLVIAHSVELVGWMEGMLEYSVAVTKGVLRLWPKA